ncbi:TPA: hypothetical protein HA270_01170 [Candidatus Woesearchaeota archaeon]|nr:hypothetical protein [Candidatus Woesearchaeota archaeon]
MKQGKRKFGKHAQVALFIIIGMILIASLGLFLYFQSRMGQKHAVILPEAVPVASFIEDCTAQTAKEAIDLVGLNGGYVALPDEFAHDPLSYLSTGPIGKNPYWWHDGITNIPPLEFIEGQIASYVESNMAACINGFAGFNHSFAIGQKGAIVADVQINEEDISVALTYPLAITSTATQAKSTLSAFQTTIPVRLKKAYGMAQAIIEQNKRDGFLEQRTIDLMALDQDKEIPLTGIEVTCSQKEWPKAAAKERLKDLLQANLQFIRIAGTSFESDSYIPLPEEVKGARTFSNSYYNYHYIWDVTENPDTQLKVGIRYDNRFPMLLSARPSDGNVLKSNAQKGQAVLSFFCMHIWHFVYDLTYPVIITVTDPQANGHSEFRLTIASQVNIRSNQPSRSSQSFSAFDSAPAITDDEYCSDLFYDTTVFTSDAKTGLDVGEVNLSLICGKFACPLGVSGVLPGGTTAGLRRAMPLCTYGFIKGVREGYAETRAPITTSQREGTASLLMQPVKEFHNYTFLKHRKTSDGIAQGMPLEPGEKAVITIKNTDSESDFESYLTYPFTIERAITIKNESDEPVEKLVNESMPLTLLAHDDYTYELAIYLINGNNITGGFAGNWTTTYEEVDDGREVLFHLIETDAKGDDQFLFIGSLALHSEGVPEPKIR